MLEYAMDHMLMSNELVFFYLRFDRHLIQAFKHSSECFRIFITFLKKVMNFQAGKEGIKGNLKLADQFLWSISQVWDKLYYLNNEEEKII